MQLWNTLDRATLEKHLQAIGHQYITISFYQYAHLTDPQAFRNQLYLSWKKLDIVGRTYVAKEGINAQISLPAKKIEAFRAHLYTYDFMNGIRLNVAIEQDSFLWFLALRK